MELQWEYMKEHDCYCAAGIVYCSNPAAPELQALNIYVPAAYRSGDGGRTSRTGAQYTAKTAPVVYYNDVGGYSECKPAPLTERNTRFLQDGYVLVSAGARGRQTRTRDGRAVGKAPAALVDLKAGIRWLRRHADDLPGDYEKIISVGTSAGGAMSALLGVSGNCAAFLPYLAEIGAEPDMRDDIFAAQCYCPIVDLEHADMAYEWMFGGKRIYTRESRCPPQRRCWSPSHPP